MLELSTRATINDAFQVAAELRSYLTANGIDLSGEQETKTRKALDVLLEAEAQGCLRDGRARPSLRSRSRAG